jgi:Uma2 family endonuclease
MATKTLLTIEQFDRLPVKEGILYELNEGEVVTMTEPMPRHNFIRDNIADAVKDFIKPRKLGRVAVEMGYQLTPDTVRIPDVSFLPADRMREIDLDRRIQGAPALAVEVVSPSDLAEELTHKVEQYIAAGSKSVWVVYPKSREVHVFHASGVKVHRDANAALEDQELFPGFSLAFSVLFEG